MLLNDIGDLFDDLCAFLSCDESIDFPRLTFTYDTERNRFMDECGFPVNNIYDYITATDLYLFRQRKEYSLTVVDGIFIELIWPEEH